MTEVTGINAILATKIKDYYYWGHGMPAQTPVVVTYNFSSNKRADKLGLIYGDDFSKFNAAQRANFRDAADKFEATAGIIFVEVDGNAMINVVNGHATGSGGYAS